MSIEKFFKKNMHQVDQPVPELQIVEIPREEINRSPHMPPELIDKDSGDFVNEQEDIGRKRDQKDRPITYH